MEEQTGRIGDAAGLLWKVLEGKSEGLSPTQLKNKTELGADLLHQAIGWLAREDKIVLLGAGKSLKIALK
jgi:hypothetical protein